MTRPRTKKQNKGLPKGWRKRGNSYRYQVPKDVRHLWDGKCEFTLGTTLPEAYRVWADRMDQVATSDQITINELLDRYLLEVVPQKAFSTQKSNQITIGRVRGVFGSMYLSNLTLTHVRDYLQLAIRKYGDTPAYHLRQCLSHILTMALQWGYVDYKLPVTSIQVSKGSARTRFLTDAEVGQILSLPVSTRGMKLIKLYLKFKLATGLRKGDILSIKQVDINEDGIYVQPRKTRKSSGKKLLFTWDEDGYMKDLVEEIRSLPPYGDHLFVTMRGTPYIDGHGECNSFDAVWKEFRRRVMKETDVTETFQERDFRAKVASESDSVQEASERLGHSSVSITKKVYIRKPVAIKPLIREY